MTMKIKRRTEITIESREVWIIRNQQRATPTWRCECADEGLMLTPEQAARLLCVTPRTIYRWVEAGRTHFRKTENGWLLVCLASLSTEENAPPSRLGAPLAALG